MFAFNLLLCLPLPIRAHSWSQLVRQLLRPTAHLRSAHRLKRAGSLAQAGLLHRLDAQGCIASGVGDEAIPSVEFAAPALTGWGAERCERDGSDDAGDGSASSAVGCLLRAHQLEGVLLWRCAAHLGCRGERECVNGKRVQVTDW